MLRLIFLISSLIIFNNVIAQDPETDTFFLSKKKGLLGKIGRSISTDNPNDVPVKTVNPFLRFAGKKIRSITIVGLDFNRSLNDTGVSNTNFPIRVANAFHKNTREQVVRNNLFFKEGDVLIPFMLSDNERFLREQSFLQDALIFVLPDAFSEEYVEVIVVVRDVFSIGGRLGISSLKEVEVEVREENLAGTGTRLAVGALYDSERRPDKGLFAEVTNRNIRGSFVNWKMGTSTYKDAFNSGRNEELFIYSSLERPMFSRYTRWTGSLDLEFHKTYNRYIEDSLYNNDFKYQNLRTDFWAGYNIGYRRARLTDHTNRLRHFVSFRTFYNHFYSRPDKFSNEYNFAYADLNGALLGYTLYRQNFYKTNFIYGFGRNEDIPEGINVSATGGWTNKSGKKRGYYGLSAEGSKYFTVGNYVSFIARTGTYVYKGKLEDIDLLLQVDHITSLKKLSPVWRNRSFFTIGVARQYNAVLNTPLFLDSDFGLPYFRGEVLGTFRSTVRAESVFYNLKKYFGFRFAPFVFGDFLLLKPKDRLFHYSSGYTAIGGGFRTRNENLIFGTIEIRGYYFPRRTIEMTQSWKVDFSTNIKFKYNSSFIRRPDFVVNN